MKKSAYTVTLIVLFLIVSIPVSADDWVPPGPFYVLSGCETMVFFVKQNAYSSDWADFPPTGLYYNTEPLEPIYLVDKTSLLNSVPLWEQDFVFSACMRYFVWIPQMNKMHTTVPNAIALAFYGNGVSLQKYTVADLVMDVNTVGRSVTMARWVKWPRYAFDADSNHLTVTTVDDITHIFDITTGDIISTAKDAFSSSQGFSTVRIWSFLIIAAGCTLLMTMGLKRKFFKI
ncbi:MAG: hypothetical protein FWC32_03650 [Firmicutes bacterium]|nr:hypothetical protein [Bacillota bacterium]